MKKENRAGAIMHLDGLEKSDFCDFEKPAIALIRKGKLSPANKARRIFQNHKSLNTFTKKSRMRDRVKSLGKVDRSKNRPEPGLDLLNPFEMD